MDLFDSILFPGPGQKFSEGVAEAAIADANARDDWDFRWDSVFPQHESVLDDYFILTCEQDDFIGGEWGGYPEHWYGGLELRCVWQHLIRTAQERDALLRALCAPLELGAYPEIVPGYVRVIDGTPVLITEDSMGNSLSEAVLTGCGDGYLYSGKPEEVLRRLLDIAMQSARALQLVHDAGFVHGDVCPERFRTDFRRYPTPVEWDLRLAGVGWMQTVAPFASRHADGAEWSLCGYRYDPETGSYYNQHCSAPEVAVGNAPDARSDIYSWGVMLASLFCGGSPYLHFHDDFGPNARRFVQRVYGHEGIPMPDRLWDLLNWCMDEDPALRPVSFAQIGEILPDIYAAAIGTPYPRRWQETRPGTVCNSRALYFLDLRQPETAERLLLRARELEPDEPSPIYNLTLLRLRQGTLAEGEGAAALQTLRRMGSAPQLINNLTEALRDPAQSKHDYYPCVW